MPDLNDYILAKAIENKICKPWAAKIAKAKNTDELMEMYVRGIDFCLDNNFPSNDDLRRLSGGINNQYGVYIDQEIKITDRPFLVLLGECAGEINCTGFSVTKLHTKHSSHVRVNAQGNAVVAIDCFDQSFLDIHAGDQSTVLISVYGNAEVIHTSTGNARIKITNKLKDTY